MTRYSLFILAAIAAGITTMPLKTLAIAERHAVTMLAQSVEASDAAALLQQGLQQFQAGQVEAAIRSWQQASDRAAATQDKLTQGKALINLGVAYRSLQRQEEALAAYQQALAMGRALSHRPMEANALANLGRIYTDRQEYDGAIAAYQQALPLVRGLGNESGEAAIAGGLALAYELQGDYTNAAQAYQQLLTLAEALQDTETIKVARESLKRVEQFLADAVQSPHAVPGAASSATGTDEDAGRRAEALALVTQGGDLLQQEKFADAIPVLERGRAIAAAIDDLGLLESSLGNLATAHAVTGNYAKSLAYAEQLLAAANRSNHWQRQSQALQIQAQAYLQLGQPQQAIPLHQQNSALVQAQADRFREAVILAALGETYLALSPPNLDSALPPLQRSLALAETLGEAELVGIIQGNLGKLYALQSDYPQAIERLQRSLASEQASGSPSGEAFARNNLGTALFLSGNLAAAEAQFRTAIALWEAQRAANPNDALKISLFETQALTYRLLQDVLVAQGQPQQALEVAERGRARAFVEQLAQRLALVEGEETATPLPAVSSPSLAEIQQVARQQNATLVAYSITYENAAIFRAGRREGRQQNRETALLIWVVQPSGEVSFRRQPLTESLADLVTDARTAIGAGNRAAIVPELRQPDVPRQTRALQQLHQLLIAPIADVLPADPAARTIFIPQESLFLVPFAALQDETGQFLLEKHAIQTAPAIQVLQLARQRQQQLAGSATAAAAPPLIVGNPIMPRIATQPGATPQSLRDLPGARAEAIAIANLLKTKAITGAQATKARVVAQMPQARIIHLATHGLLDDFKGQGIPGAVALAPNGTGERNDGLLTANEIFDLDLKAELVVLSACDTGRGEITGDGVIGLSRSLIVAGAPSVVVSLWKVPDEATAFLMEQFYQNLQQGSDKAQALRQAMLATRSRYPDPLDWAAFTLIGEAE